MAPPTRDADAGRPADWAAPGARLVASAAADAQHIPALTELGQVHIIGIAGAGTSALARLLHARGVAVSGCESRMSATVTQLRELGVAVTVGHSARHVDAADTVVFNTALDPHHLEIEATLAAGKRLLRRAAALAAAIGGQPVLAVAGTHGKTTTASLLTVGLRAAGADPSFALGGVLVDPGINAWLGTGELFVVEADESDGSFLLLHPSAALVTNVEADHLENYGDLAGIHRAFEMFVDQTTPEAILLVDVDDDGARRVGEYGRRRGRTVVAYGQSGRAQVRVRDVEELPDATRFWVDGLDTVAPDTDTPASLQVTVASLVGAHIARNAAGALAMGASFGLDVSAMGRAWTQFRGVRRRFELRGEAAGVRVYDDYAHHPTEVAAQLHAAHAVTRASGGRLIGVFQPGTYSRTQTFAAEFGQAMAEADVAVVLDIFAAREEPIPGVTGQLIAERVPLPAADVIYEPDFGAAAARIAQLAGTGDVVVTMGIGDVHLLCPQILQFLEDRMRPVAQ